LLEAKADPNPLDDGGSNQINPSTFPSSNSYSIVPSAPPDPIVSEASRERRQPDLEKERMVNEIELLQERNRHLEEALEARDRRPKFLPDEEKEPGARRKASLIISNEILVIVFFNLPNIPKPIF
jgi:hypothetical protein